VLLGACEEELTSLRASGSVQGPRAWRLGYAHRVETWFHVSSAANRNSIRVHGLDWTRMGAARGIAGSTVPEADGVFLCPDEFTVGFFVRMNNTGGPVDVWAVSGIDKEQMSDNGSGFFYFPGRISPGQVTLIESASADAAPSDTPSRVRRKQKKTPRTRDGHHSRRRRLHPHAIQGMPNGLTLRSSRLPGGQELRSASKRVRRRDALGFSGVA
jgi:hypothetical protein